MRFYTRDIFGLTLIVAVGMFAVSSTAKLRRVMNVSDVERRGLQRLDIEISRRDNSPRFDGFATVAEMSKSSAEKFDQIRFENSAIEPRSGDVLSIRRVPSLPNEDHEFRLLVPEGMPVWLKYGLRALKDRYVDVADEDWYLTETLPAVRDGDFADQGPFELRLAPGDHRLSIRVGDYNQHAVPLSILVDSTVVLKTEFKESFVAPGLINIDPRTQLDIGTRSWSRQLGQVRIVARDRRDDITRGSDFIAVIWLSDSPSEFEGFPPR